MKFSYYSNLYLEFGKKEWKYSTYCKNLGIVKNRLFIFNEKDINQITSIDIKNFIISLNDVGNKSIKHYLSSLSQIFELAILNKEISQNPLNYIKKISYKSPKIVPFNNYEVNKILNNLDDKNENFKIFLQVGFFTGMRTGEILALKISQIDLQNKMININSTRSRFGETSTKTEFSIRQIPIINSLLPYLDNFIKSHKNNFYLLEKNSRPFRDTSEFSKEFKILLKKLNIPYRRLYNMRHSYATNLLYKNLVFPLELSQLLGHSTTKMVYDVYVNYVKNRFENFNFGMNIY